MKTFKAHFEILDETGRNVLRCATISMPTETPGTIFESAVKAVGDMLFELQLKDNVRKQLAKAGGQSGSAKKVRKGNGKTSKNKSGRWRP